MPSQIETYEQKYCVLVAEITSRIGRLKINGSENAEQLVKEIQSNFEEAVDLLEQLDLEVQVSGGQSSRVACHKAELQRVKDEFTKALATAGTSFVDGIDQFDEWHGSDLKQTLLQNSERNIKVHRNADTHKVDLEIEQLEDEHYDDLGIRRERTRERLPIADDEGDASAKLLNTAVVRSIQEKFVLYIFILIFGVMLFGGLYFSL